MKKLWEYEGYPYGIEDYRRFPIWLMGDDSEFFVPVEVTDPLIYDDDDVIAYAMFVYCTVRLRDDTVLEGVVYLGDLDEPGSVSPYHLEVLYEGETLSVREGTWQMDKKVRKEFAQRLGKPLETISPLTWETPYRIRWHLRWNPDWGPNGITAECSVSGQIDLFEWYEDD